MTVANNDRSELLRRPINDLSRLSSPSGNKDRASRFRRLILTPFALFLVWAPLALFLVCEVITRSGAAYLADARPEMAIQLRSTNPTALLNLAEAELKRDQARDSPAPVTVDPEARTQIRSRAELALRNDPLNARAFRILGELADRSSTKEQTERFMQAAGRRSLHESVAVYWMMQKNYQDGDYRAAIRFADTLLRTRSDSAQQVMPMLGKIAENPNTSDDLKQLLAGNPPWRPEFFDRLSANISDARTPLDILLRLKDTPTPPTSAELRSYLNFLISRGIYELAYYTWLSFLPPDQLSKVGRLFNGDFEFAPSGLPFDWIIPQGSGATVKVSERPDKEGDHALLLEFGVGRVDLRPITQLIVLPPGQYRFEGKHNVEVVSQRGLQWRITCAGREATQIAESPVAQGSRAAWEDFSFSFTVPETDCAAQYIRLVFDARWASEQFISGSVWYDDLQIVREPTVNP
jgi:hypothetical protein